MNDVPHGMRAQRRAAQKKLVRRIGMVASALSVVLVVTVFTLIMRNERAHNDSECKFALSGEAQTLGEARVYEETRSCLPEVEERRYLVSRAGKASYELARKRLPKVVFADFRWALRTDKDGLVLDMFVRDKLDSESHEADAVHK